eukprot:2438393-Rhodomonas_salina.3
MCIRDRVQTAAPSSRYPSTRCPVLTYECPRRCPVLTYECPRRCPVLTYECPRRCPVLSALGHVRYFFVGYCTEPGHLNIVPAYGFPRGCAVLSDAMVLSEAMLRPGGRRGRSAAV